MEKIDTIYNRDETVRGHPVIPGIKQQCAWVEEGEGIATRKLDGTNAKIESEQLFKRKKPKDGDYDRASYVPCDRNNPADKYLFQAFDALPSKDDGIYECVGPKIQGNPEGYEYHQLVAVVPPSPSLNLGDVPRYFEGLREYLACADIEGIVFHNPDGRLAKIKKRDFGLKRKPKQKTH